LKNQIDNIAYSIARQINPKDELKRIELQVMIEDIIESVRTKDVLDTEDFLDLSLLGVPFVEYLMKYKSISSDEARALISYGYITYYDFMLILKSGMKIK